MCRALYESSIAYSRIARISSAVHRCKWRKYTNVERYGVDQLPSCLPMTCQTYKVQSDDTCWSIAAALDDGTTTTDLISYNPTLNGVCGNLIAGENICISPATGEYIPTIIPGATATQTNVYATETVLPPGPTASDTTTKCGKYYQVQSGDVCQQISLNNTITVDLFRAINPSIDQNCFNLSPSLWYCVRPTFDWNQTDPTITPSVTAIPPAPTAPGTTGSCYTWYTVKSGDYGSLITSSYGITMQRFQQWNPSIDDNCSNLILGNA